MRDRCPSTVRSERKSAAATSRFVFPSATRAATRSSAGVSAPGVAARPLIRRSSSRARSGPELRRRCARTRESLLQRRTRLPPPLHSAAALHRARAACDRGRAGARPARAIRAPPRTLTVQSSSFPSWAARSPRQRDTVGERRCALEPARVALVPVEHLDGLVLSPELDQRLDRDRRRTGSRRARRWPPDGRKRRSARAAQEPRPGAPSTSSEVAEGLRGDELRPRPPVVGTSSSMPAGGGSCLARPAQLRLDEALEGEVVREDGVLSRLFGRLLPLERPSPARSRAHREGTRRDRAGRGVAEASSRRRARVAALQQVD